MMQTRIVLADDQLLIRAGICALIDALPDYCVEAACADGDEALAAIGRIRPDMALLDIAMPGLTGIDVTKEIRRTDADTRILILSSIDRRDVVDQALGAGANGYLLKDFLLSDLQTALDAVRDGHRFITPKISDTKLSAEIDEATNVSSTPNLTARQREILRLVASGKTSKEIARELGISPKTVEFHRAGLMERLGVRDVTALTRYAVLTGVVS